MTAPIHAWMEDGFPTGSVFHAARAAWPHRGLPNLYFLHYRDLRLDLEGEMRRLARFLGIRVAPAAWPALVEAASFDAMRVPRRRHRARRPPRRLGEQRRLLRQRPAGRVEATCSAKPTRRCTRNWRRSAPSRRCAHGWRAAAAPSEIRGGPEVSAAQRKGAAEATPPSSALVARQISCRFRTGRRRPGRRRCTSSRRRTSRCRGDGLPGGCGRCSARRSCRTDGRWRSSRH